MFILHNKIACYEESAAEFFHPCIFSLQSFSQLLSWTADLIREISTTVVSTVDAIIEAKHIIIAGNKVIEIKFSGGQTLNYKHNIYS